MIHNISTKLIFSWIVESKVKQFRVKEAHQSHNLKVVVQVHQLLYIKRAFVNGKRPAFQADPASSSPAARISLYFVRRFSFRTG